MATWSTVVSWGSVGRSSTSCSAKQAPIVTQSGRRRVQEAVVVPAALAEPPAVGRERQAGHDDDIELGRVDIAGLHP